MNNPPGVSEKPQNGIEGLKRWRHDLQTGLQVALVPLPLSLGTAIAAGHGTNLGIIGGLDATIGTGNFFRSEDMALSAIYEGVCALDARSLSGLGGGSEKVGERGQNGANLRLIVNLFNENSRRYGPFSRFFSPASLSPTGS